MTTDQTLLFGLLALILGMLLWGRWRHDLVAAGGLLVAVVLGLVPTEQAFSGFSNHAVVIVALVLVASRAFENTGALSVLTRWAIKDGRSTGTHITMLGGLGAALSAVINNVAALAILMPMDVQAAQRAGRPPGVTLMPLAFSTILGGLVTLIGTPPNIIASAVRQQQLGQPYGMFDFTPVGGVVAIVGILFVALIGWRLVPRRQDKAAEMMSTASFQAELLVPEESVAIGRMIADLDEETEKADVALMGIVRETTRHRHFRAMSIAAGDLLMVRGSTDSIAAFIKMMGLQEPLTEDSEKDGAEKSTPAQTQNDAADAAQKDEKDEDKEEDTAPKPPEIIEAVVKSDSYLVGRSAGGMSLRPRFGLMLLGIGRAGSVTRERVRRRTIESGDVLLLSGRAGMTPTALDQLGLIPVNRVSVAQFRPRDAALTVGLFAAAVLAASTGLLDFTVAIAIAVAAYGALGLVPARDFYDQIDWPVVVMIACLLPLGVAFEKVGGTALIANAISAYTQAYPPVVALTVMMLVTMTLSDMLNNVATIVITGPIAIDLAKSLHANPDTFLMGVAIAASCAFLTPIGHKNNMLIMGPGGFRFSDYWRMGLPLELVVLAVAVPMLLLVWPIGAVS